MTKQAIREGFDQLRPGDQLQPLESAARARSEADWLVGHERDPRGDDPRPRLGRRGRLARPRPDADARDHRPPRARDPGVRPGAVLARARELRPALRGSLVRPDQGRRQGHAYRPGDLAQGGRACRGDRREGLRQDGDRRGRRAQGAVRARAAPLRPDVASARCEQPLRVLRAPHAPGRPVARTRARRRSPTRARAPAGSPATSSRSSSRPPRRSSTSPSTRPRRSSCSGSTRFRSAGSSTTRRSTTTTRSSPPTSSTTSASSRPTSAASSTSSPGASWPCSIRRRATRGRPSSPSSRTSASAPAARSRSRPGGAASTALRPMPIRRRTPRAPSSRRSRRASRSRSSPSRARPRRRGPRRATPRRRCSQRWRPRASSSTTRSSARR